MRIGLILYGCTEDNYRALYTLSELELVKAFMKSLRMLKGTESGVRRR